MVAFLKGKKNKIIEKTEVEIAWEKMKLQRKLHCEDCGSNELKFIQSQHKGAKSPKNVFVNVSKCLSCGFISIHGI